MNASIIGRHLGRNFGLAIGTPHPEVPDLETEQSIYGLLREELGELPTRRGGEYAKASFRRNTGFPASDLRVHSLLCGPLRLGDFASNLDVNNSQNAPEFAGHLPVGTGVVSLRNRSTSVRAYRIAGQRLSSPSQPQYPAACS